MFHLDSEWRKIARRAWSVRLLLAAMVLSGLEAVIPYFDVSPLVIFGIVALALYARHVAQEGLDG